MLTLQIKYLYKLGKLGKNTQGTIKNNLDRIRRSMNERQTTDYSKWISEFFLDQIDFFLGNVY